MQLKVDNLTALQLYSNNSSFEEANYALLTKSLLYLTQSFLLKHIPTLMFIVSCRHNNTCNMYNDLLDRLLQQWHIGSLQLLVLPQQMGGELPGKNKCNIMLVDSFEAFTRADYLNYATSYDAKVYYFVHLQMPNPQYEMTHMKRILRHCWRRNVINCSVQLQSKYGQLIVYTYYPFVNGHCGNSEPVRINKFLGERYANFVIFPKKIKNLNQCPLKAALWHVPPFLHLEQRQNEMRVVRGIEGQLLLSLSAILNFSIEVKVPPHDEQRGLVGSNYSSGALRMLLEGSVDLSLGSFRLTPERKRFVTASDSYYQSSYVAAVVLNTFELNSWHVLKYPFRSYTWFALFVAYLLTSLQIIVLRILFKNSKAQLIDVFLISLGMPAQKLPKTAQGRLFWFNWFIFTLIMRTIYQAMLYHLIRSHIYENLPSTMEELLQSNYTAVLTQATAGSVSEASIVRQFRKTVIDSNDETSALAYIAETGQKSFFCVGIFDFLQHYAMTHQKPGYFMMVRQRVLTYQPVIYLAKHSYLTSEINKQILRIRSGGFMELWSHREIDFNYFNSKHMQEEQPNGLKQLYMVFVLYAIGLFMATMVFCLELAAKKCLFLRKLLRSV